MSQADGFSLQVGHEMSDLALHQSLPGELVLLAGAAGLQHYKMSIFTEKVGSLKQGVPGEFAGHNVLADLHAVLELALHHFQC